MKKILDDYKEIIRIIIILLIFFTVLTILHVAVKSLVQPKDNNINVLSMGDMIDEGAIDNIDYEIVEKDIKNTIKNIENNKEASYNDNSYYIIYYESACKIIENKMQEIKCVLEDRLDESSINELNYAITKFYEDLSKEEENIYRVYQSSIDARLNVYKERYDRLKDKSLSLASEYKSILDKRDGK